MEAAADRVAWGRRALLALVPGPGPVDVNPAAAHDHREAFGLTEEFGMSEGIAVDRNQVGQLARLMPRRLTTGPGAGDAGGPATTSAYRSPATTTVPSKGSPPVAVNTLALVEGVVHERERGAQLGDAVIGRGAGLTGITALSALSGGTYGGCGPVACRAGGW